MIQNKGSLSEKFAHCAKYALGCAVIAGEVVFKVTKSTAKIAAAGVFGYVGGLYGIAPMFEASPYGAAPDPQLSSLCMGGALALLTASIETENSRQWLGQKISQVRYQSKIAINPEFAKRERLRVGLEKLKRQRRLRAKYAKKTY